MIDVTKLKEIVKLMVDNDLTELDLQDQSETVTLRRGQQPSTVVNHQPVFYGGGGGAVSAPVAAAAPAPMAAPAGGGAAAPAKPAEEAGLIYVESPMVGTCYMSPNPDAPHYVKDGSTVNGSSVVCLIEAMKVFNEIKAEKSGTVVKILVKNGEAVEFGQKLFALRP